jgi:flagellar basal-body rod protein FlgC
MGLFDSFRIAASGMTAQRLRMDVIADNVANAGSTKASSEQPYRRKLVVFQEALDQQIASSARPGTLRRAGQSAGATGTGLGGVRVVSIVEDSTPGRLVYDPGHPHADANGYVQMPNVDIVREMVDMISASRAYESNVAVLDAAKSMFLKALEIGR